MPGEPGVGVGVGTDQRLFRLGHPPGDAVPNFQPQGFDLVGTRSPGQEDKEFPFDLVHFKDGAHLGVQRLLHAHQGIVQSLLGFQRRVDQRGELNQIGQVFAGIDEICHGTPGSWPGYALP